MATNSVLNSPPQSSPAPQPLKPASPSIPVSPVSSVVTTQTQSGIPVRSAVIPTQVPKPVSKHPPQKRTLVMVIGGIVLVLAAFGFYYQSQLSVIVIADQPFSDNIHVKKLVVKKPGFLVLRRITPFGVQSIVDSTAFLEPEQYNDFDFHLNADTFKSLAPGDTLYATMYQDANNNQAFDDDVDTEMKDIFGLTHRVHFKLN